MVSVGDFVSRVEGTCGKEKDVIVVFRYERKDEAVKKIVERTCVKKAFAGVVFELGFKKYSFRLYASGKVIFRGLESKEELNRLLSDLLL